MGKFKQFVKSNWIYILSLIYILSPIDLIPGDVATGIGLIDDLGVLLLTGGYAVIKTALDNKKEEKEQKERTANKQSGV